MTCDSLRVRVEAHSPRTSRGKRGEGFTVSEFDPAKWLMAAVIDQARKHRRRPPDEVRRIEEHRKRQTR